MVGEEAVELDGGPSPPPVLYQGPHFPPQAPCVPPAQDQGPILVFGQHRDALEDRLVEWWETSLNGHVMAFTCFYCATVLCSGWSNSWCPGWSQRCTTPLALTPPRTFPQTNQRLRSGASPQTLVSELTDEPIRTELLILVKLVNWSNSVKGL